MTWEWVVLILGVIWAIAVIVWAAAYRERKRG